MAMAEYGLNNSIMHHNQSFGLLFAVMKATEFNQTILGMSISSATVTRRETMDFSLSKEQKLIQKAAYDYSHHQIKPMVDTIMNTNHIPDEMLMELGELGMFGIPFPEEYGGGGAGYLDYILALEQLSSVCPGVGMIISVNTVGLSVIHALGTEEQKNYYLPRGMKGRRSFPLLLRNRVLDQIQGN